MYGKYTRPTDPMGGEICEDDIWMFFDDVLASHTWIRFVEEICHWNLS